MTTTLPLEKKGEGGIMLPRASAGRGPRLFSSLFATGIPFTLSLFLHVGLTLSVKHWDTKVEIMDDLPTWSSPNTRSTTRSRITVGQAALLLPCPLAGWWWQRFLAGQAHLSASLSFPS